MKNLTGRVAVVFAAVAVAALASPLAAAQEKTVALEGLVWFDRDADGVVDADEPPKANGSGVRVFNATTKEFIGEYGTDANGRYKVENLPDVPLAIYSDNTARFEATTKSTFNPVSGGGTFDFGIRGGTIHGFGFVDSNRDGVKQSGEEVPEQQPGTLVFYSGGLGSPGVVMFNMTRGADGEFTYRDLASGEYVFTAADRSPDLMLAPSPAGGHDVDPVTREKALRVFSPEPLRVDARYVRPNADFVVGTPRLEPAKDAYRIGDEVTLTVSVTNRGEAADKPSFVMFGSTPEFVSASDTLVVRHPGQDFETHDLMAVGATVELSLTYRLDNPEFDRFHLFARPVSVLNRRDVNSRDNHAIVPLKYLPAESTNPSAPETTTTAPTAPTTTTTAVPVAQVASGSKGLASTGASPFLFLAIGGLLIGGGALTFLAARRRRRA